MMVGRLCLAVPRGCLQFVIVVFPDHTHYFLWGGFTRAGNIMPNLVNLQEISHGKVIYSLFFPDLSSTGNSLQDRNTCMKVQSS